MTTVKLPSFASVQKIILKGAIDFVRKDYMLTESHQLESHLSGYNGTLRRERKRDFGCSIIRGISFIVRKC